MTKKYSSDKGMQKLFEGFNRFLNEEASSEGRVRQGKETIRVVQALMDRMGIKHDNLAQIKKGIAAQSDGTLEYRWMSDEKIHPISALPPMSGRITLSKDHEPLSIHLLPRKGRDFESEYYFGHVPGGFVDEEQYKAKYGIEVHGDLRHNKPFNEANFAKFIEAAKAEIAGSQQQPSAEPEQAAAAPAQAQPEAAPEKKKSRWNPFGG